ncbi:MAG: metal ABC transporter permease [Kiritimatiellae bacterium]|nr:metal ABC transporter permease [Kiritimatiellia bacterium]
MNALLDPLAQYFSLPFVRNAVVVGVMIAVSASLLGVPLVLRRFSLLGDGLSHVAFGAMAVAAVVGLTNDMPLILAITIACAIVLLRAGRGARTGGDAAIAMMSAGALAVGYLLMNLFPRSGNVSGDVCTTLFGSVSILTLSPADVATCAILSALVILCFVFFHHRIFAVTFDEEFAAATGVGVRAQNLWAAVLIAIVIVLSMRLVGALLISALVVFPALSAMRLWRSFRAVVWGAAGVSAGCAVIGLLISILCGTPVGATIVAADIACFGLACALGALRRRT